MRRRSVAVIAMPVTCMPMRMIAMPVIAVSVIAVSVISVTMIIMPMLVRNTDRRADNLIANKESQRFPEVPPGASNRLSVADSRRQSTKDQKRQNECHNLQHHELRDLKSANRGQLKLHAEWTFEERKIAHVMEMVSDRKH